jgi:DNA-binding XRE family transcriptional regulator
MDGNDTPVARVIPLRWLPGSRGRGQGRELPEFIALEIGARIRALRLAATPPLTQAAAAEALGITQPALSDLEGGRKSPSLSTLLRLQATYHLASIDELLGDAGSARFATAFADDLDRRS